MTAAAYTYTADDWQAQLEEVLALKSIYAENFRVLHLPGQPSVSQCHTTDTSSSTSSTSSTTSGGGGCGGGDAVDDIEQQLEALISRGDPPAPNTVTAPLCCEALVSVELPAGQLQLMVGVPQMLSGNKQQPPSPPQQQSQQQQQQQQLDQQQQQQQEGSEELMMPFGPPLKHLPPIRMTLQLPPNYPSSEHAPPSVSLHASWLSSAQQQALQAQLHQVWQEQGPGLPVCFSWLEHIKVSALPALGITEQLVLTEQQQQQQGPQQHGGPEVQQQQQQQKASDDGRHRCNGACGSSSSSSSRDSKHLSAEAPSFVPTAAAAAAVSRSSSAARQGGKEQQQQLPPPPPQQQQQQQRAVVLQAPTPPAPSSPSAAAAAQTVQTKNSSSSSSSSSIPVDQLALQLLRYDAAREADDFNNSSWTCNICFEQVPGSACLRLPECRHFYCKPCLSSSAAAQLDSGAVENMRCPEPSCRRLLPPYVVKELLGDEAFAKWEEMVLSRALDRMDDVVYCPRCETVSVADADGCAQCAKCYYAFCAECSDSWHPGTPCLNLEERVRILGRRRRGTTAEDRLRDMDLQNQAMNLRYISQASKACPTCGMATIKNEGCNKMTCGNCSSHWCWKCGQAVQGYDHFRAPEGSTNPLCVLFDQAEIDRWHAMLFANERAAQVDVLHAGVIRARNNAGAAARLCRCPVCGQENLREGRNNLLRCWSCTSHFCYACRTWLRSKVGQHFVGAGACKQHGD